MVAGRRWVDRHAPPTDAAACCAACAVTMGAAEEQQLSSSRGSLPGRGAAVCRTAEAVCQAAEQRFAARQAAVHWPAERTWVPCRARTHGSTDRPSDLDSWASQLVPMRPSKPVRSLTNSRTQLLAGGQEAGGAGL